RRYCYIGSLLWWARRLREVRGLQVLSNVVRCHISYRGPKSRKCRLFLGGISIGAPYCRPVSTRCGLLRCARREVGCDDQNDVVARAFDGFIPWVQRVVVICDPEPTA